MFIQSGKVDILAGDSQHKTAQPGHFSVWHFQKSPSISQALGRHLSCSVTPFPVRPSPFSTALLHLVSSFLISIPAFTILI